MVGSTATNLAEDILGNAHPIAAMFTERKVCNANLDVMRYIDLL